ncbi:MAG: T9SS type A sorting domain-containing protein [Saprospiraceae bacterium]
MFFDVYIFEYLWTTDGAYSRQEGYSEIFKHGVEFEPGRLLTVSAESFDQGADNNFQISHLRIVNLLNGEIINEVEYKIDSLSTSLSYIYFSETNNNIIVVGEAHSTEIGNRRGYFLTTVWDKSLNKITDTIVNLYPINENNVLWYLMGDKVNKNELSIIGFYNADPVNLFLHYKVFLAKISLDGKIVTTNWYSAFDFNVHHPSIFYDSAISEYVLMGAMTCYLDSNLNLIDCIYAEDISEHYNGNLGISSIFNDKYLTTIQYKSGTDRGIGLYNRDLSIEKGINLSDISDSSSIDFTFARQNYDWIDTNSIFVGQQDLMTFYLTIARVNSKLDPFWIKYIGRNDTIFNYGWSVIATSDGGCVLTGGVGEALSPGYIQGLLSGWLLKLDSEGNHISSTTMPNNNWEITVFPNPSIGDFRIDLGGEIGGSELHLYDLQGRELEKYKNLSEGENDFDFSELVSGVYIWNLMRKGEVIGKGKWVKK